MLIETAEPHPHSVAPLLESLGTGQFGTGLFRFVAKHIPIAVCTAF